MLWPLAPPPPFSAQMAPQELNNLCFPKLCSARALLLHLVSHPHMNLTSSLPCSTDTVYGLGSSIFFVGYSLFQVPSNLILLKLGGRTWLAIMLVAWGLVATAFAAMQSTSRG